MSSALTGDIRTGGERPFEYATASINVNETARSDAAGMELSRWEIALLEKERSASQPRAAPQYRRAGRVDPVELGRVGRDDTLLEYEAAIEAPFTGLDHAIGFLREFIEVKSLDRAHWQRAALSSVDLTLHLDLHGRNLVGLADDLHSQGRLVDEGIERQDRKDRACRPAGRYVIDPI